MRRIGIAVILSLVCATATAGNRSDKIRALMEAQGLVKTFEQQIEANREHTRKMAEEMIEKELSTVTARADIQARFKEAARDYVEAAQSPFTAQDIIEAWGKYYGAKFSDEELDQLLNFYRSPLGQKDVIASREALVPYTAEFQARYKPILEKATQEFIDRIQAIVKTCQCKKQVESAGT